MVSNTRRSRDREEDNIKNEPTKLFRERVCWMQLIQDKANW